MKDYRKLFLFSLFLGLPFLSCKKGENVFKDDSALRYQYFNLEHRGWKSKNYAQNVDNIKFVATEVPIQYYLLKDKGNEDLFMIDSLYESNKTERVIEFTFHEKDEKDLLTEEFTSLSYKKSVEYLSFTIQNDFSVITSKNDTISCSGVLHERNFKVAPFNKVMLFFSGIDPNENIQLIYKDNLFKKGTLKFQFNEPILNL